MDGGEGGMAASPEEHLISIPDHHNAGGSGASVGPESDEEDMSSLPSETNADEEWIREVEDKIWHAFTEGSAVPRASYLKKETKPKICKLPLRDRISQQRSETVERLSQPSVVPIGPFHRKDPASISDKESVVTTGPFHRKDPASISDKEKWVIVWLTNLLHNLNLGRSLLKMKDQVKEACGSYCNSDELENSGFKDEKNFAEMLLLDSYFILFTLTIQLRKGPTDYTLMPRTPNGFPKEPLTLFQGGRFKFLDIVFNKDEIAPDLLIFDNQIPFFVIEELYKELKWKKPLHEYTFEFFETIHPRSAQHCKDKNISPPEFLHLLDLFHWSRVPQNKYIELSSSPQQPDSIGQAGHIPNATEHKERATATEKKKSLPPPDPIDWARHTPNAVELRESATMFEKKTSDSSLDITFRRRRFTPVIRVLDIPEVHIRDYSSLIFHNLITFEIQFPGRGRCTMAFSALMQNLLQREKDVKLLWQRGILVSSSMTDWQLIDLFARLSRLTENHQMPHDLSNIYHQVSSHHKNLVSRLCGGIILQYFSKPVVTLSVLVAALLFVPTLLQTIYAMVYHT